MLNPEKSLYRAFTFETPTKNLDTRKKSSILGSKYATFLKRAMERNYCKNMHESTREVLNKTWN